MIYQVTPYEVYQKYLSLKQHFNKTEYDYFKFHGKVRASESSFDKRKDKQQLHMGSSTCSHVKLKLSEAFQHLCMLTKCLSFSELITI